ncbi:uncharacterized protein LOC117169735 [Belonocnema kinseyi]|uniref:uncharacterized protein LOC117169735 n=1 Tax=Belonocnema kinseyi TaxID=2817044 RepID=UPI00143D4A4A|nr:uncharacterized protein LOC117169735 [Belonocnema kinseyi]
MDDHGLVIMFQPLYDNYSQPIAVFASKGPTHGDAVVKLVIQSIALLEKAGAKVHGIVAGGGAPNRRMCTELGCSGKMEGFKNSFKHLVDEERYVFLFSDTLHLIKTIRKRLENGSKLKIHPDDGSIEWEHFEILHDLGKHQPARNRWCPNITDTHVKLKDNHFTKMRVILALQVVF